MTTDSNEEGTRAHAHVEQIIAAYDEQLKFYMLGLLDSLDQPTPTPTPVHDPRPTKGKFEPPHLFNSRMRDWNRRNP